jgi:prepilin-type N-terminal cleavage/methylation domain-containing protein
MRSTESNARGFSLVELLIAMALGLIVLTSTVQLFKGGMDATILVTQSSEMEQSARAALNLVGKDVSMAGSGMPPGGLSLPYGAGATPSFFAVDPTKAWLANNTYPTGTFGGSAVTNYMFGIIPGAGNGMELGGPANITATGQAADAVTVIYTDYAFPLNQYTATFPAANPNGDVVNFAPPAIPPVGFPAIQSPTGLQVGDLILLNNPTGYAVGEITGIAPAAAGSTNVTFANGDPLNINQTGAAKGNIKYIIAGGNPVATRIWAITYFLEVPPAANLQTPRLMRQVNGQSPSPVSDNIIGFTVTYDVCDGTIVVGCSGVPSALAAPFSPTQVHKVNIQIKAQTLTSYGRSRSTVLATSVSTRSLSFKDRYQ